MGILTRRRALMNAEEPIGTLLFENCLYGGRTERGTLTQLGNGDFTIASTGSSSWRLLDNVYGANLPIYESLKGHTVRIYYTLSWTSKIASAKFLLSLMLASSPTLQYPGRTRFQEWALQSDPDGTYYKEFVIPLTLNDWPYTDTAGTASDSNSFLWRFYLNSAAGTEVTVTNIAVYDYGII